MSQPVTRRKFLQTTAAAVGVAAGAKAFAAPAVLSEKSPNSKLGTVVIGVVNQGKPAVIAACTERLIALCDVDDNHNAQAKKFIGEQHPEIKLSAVQEFYDYRKMFDKIHKDIDAVFIAAPDHHHAVASLIAMRLGKHVYCEKPMAHSIGEVRLMMETAREYKVVTQLGNHHHSSESVRRLCEYIWAGAIGNVTETYSWARTGRGGIGGRLPAQPVPAGLHWDEWIGPAAYRDYHEKLHPKLWRSWWEFGDGSVGDWGCHNLDGVFMALKLGPPTSVEALRASRRQRRALSLRKRPSLELPGAGRDAAGQGPLVRRLQGHDRGPGEARRERARGRAQSPADRRRDREEVRPQADRRRGGLRGRQGNPGHGQLLRKPAAGARGEACKSFPVPPKTLPRVKKGLTHYTDFLRACKDGGNPPPSSHFDYGGPLTEIVLLGCLAERAGVGKQVQWDAEKAEVTNLPELNRLVRREYRKGWELG